MSSLPAPRPFVRLLLSAFVFLLSLVALAQGEAKISPGQMLRLACDEEPLVSRDYRVTQKGYILVDFVGAVKVAGLTKAEAAQAVGGLLVSNKVLKKATVKVDEATSSSGGEGVAGTSVSWAGEVENPGSVRHRPGLTLADVWPNVRPRAGADMTQVTITNPKAQPRTVSVGVASDLRSVVLAADDTINVAGRPTVVGRATILGEVASPGALDVGPYATLGELVGRAGGLSANANPDRVKLVRPGGEAKDLKLPDDASFRVGPGDTVTVDTRKARFKVPIFGRVRSPGEVEVLEGEGLNEAVAKAGGTTDGAAADRVRIHLPGQSKPRLVDLAKVQQGYSGDFVLKPGMKVEVPGGKAAVSSQTVKYAAGAAVLLFLLRR